MRKSSSYYESLADLNKKFAAAKKPPVELKEAPETLEDEDLLEMLDAGLIALVVVDKHKAEFWKQIFPKLTLHDNIVVRSGGDVAPGDTRGQPAGQGGGWMNSRTRNRVGTAIGNDAPDALPEERQVCEERRFREGAQEVPRRWSEYFQEYGAQYDVDWLLMGAQGYQESQLNQNAKSRVGAVGVMQVMPATGKDMKVGNIRETEANIHAGIKYMRWMINRTMRRNR